MKSKFYRKVLENGMIVLFEKRDLPVVSVMFAVRCGGINESTEEKGISHFIEHMLYKGTPNRNAKRIAEEIEKNGGQLNGFTAQTVTGYWCKMPARHLDIALDVLSDMIRNPLFDKKELEKERKVIFEEIKMCVDNPSSYIQDKIHNCLYEWPFGADLIGTQKTLNSMDRAKIVERFKKIYQPNNMILCVVGDTDIEKILNFARKNFKTGVGEVPKFKVIKRNEFKIEKRKGIDQANLVLAHHSSLSKDKGSYSAVVLNALMTRGLSSRLFSEIREKRNLAYFIGGNIEISKDYSYCKIYAGTSKENVETIRKLILKEFEKVSKQLEEKELQQVKEQLIGNYHISMEDSQAQMTNLLTFEIDNSDAEEFYNFEKRIKDVKLENVKKLASEVKKDYSFFALVPE